MCVLSALYTLAISSFVARCALASILADGKKRQRLNLEDRSAA